MALMVDSEPGGCVTVQEPTPRRSVWCEDPGPQVQVKAAVPHKTQGTNCACSKDPVCNKQLQLRGKSESHFLYF